MDSTREVVCSICDTTFDLQGEGGIQGFLGILPVSFCPTCLTGILDLSQQLSPERIYNEQQNEGARP